MLKKLGESQYKYHKQPSRISALRPLSQPRLVLNLIGKVASPFGNSKPLTVTTSKSGLS
jgi:hypothetical protein